MNRKTRCRDIVGDCIHKMTENMNRIIEHSQISTSEGTAYDSFLSSFSIKIQANKIVSFALTLLHFTQLFINQTLLI